MGVMERVREIERNKRIRAKVGESKRESVNTLGSQKVSEDELKKELEIQSYHKKNWCGQVQNGCV